MNTVVTSAYFISLLLIFFFNATATTKIYTLPLHDALPISYDQADLDAQARHVSHVLGDGAEGGGVEAIVAPAHQRLAGDRKSTRLNSSHANISYAVFCLKKKELLDGQAILRLAITALANTL